MITMSIPILKKEMLEIDFQIYFSVFYALAIFAVDLYSRTYFRMQILVYRYQQMLLTCYGSHNILNNQFANKIFLLKKMPFVH